MDQTIRRILELDASVEDRLRVSELEADRLLKDARKQASAIRQASRHQTRDAIMELEEQLRSESEQKIAAVRGEYDSRSEAVTKQFAAQHDALLETLFAETLRDAEA